MLRAETNPRTTGYLVILSEDADADSRFTRGRSESLCPMPVLVSFSSRVGESQMERA